MLHSIAVVTENVSIFRMEKLYAVLSQCIYQHREDGDKNELVKVFFFCLVALCHYYRCLCYACVRVPCECHGYLVLLIAA